MVDSSTRAHASKPRKRYRPPLWHKAFVEALGNTGIMTIAARQAGISRAAVYKALSKDPIFEAECRDALERATDLMEAEARRRAVLGVDEPVFNKGEPVLIPDPRGRVDEMGAIIHVPMTIKKYSDSLMALMLQANRPAKYRQNYKVEVSGPDGGPVQVEARPEREARLKAQLQLIRGSKGDQDGESVAEAQP